MALQINFLGGTFDGQSGTLDGTVIYTVGASSPPAIPPANGASLIPLMTGAMTAGVTISATSEYSESGTTASAWHVGDGVTGSGWYHAWSSVASPSAAAPQDLIFQFSSSVPVYEIDITIRTDSNAFAPISGSFDGFDGTNWIPQHAFSGLSWAAGETKIIAITPTGVFSRYRLRNTSAGALVQVTEFQAKS